MVTVLAVKIPSKTHMYTNLYVLQRTTDKSEWGFIAYSTSSRALFKKLPDDAKLFVPPGKGFIDVGDTFKTAGDVRNYFKNKLKKYDGIPLGEHSFNTRKHITFLRAEAGLKEY